ncbi:MAG: DUF4118 domain-containing protein [Acidimicrobiales bacterium]
MDRPGHRRSTAGRAAPYVAAVVAPVAVAGVGAALRDHVDNANVALALVVAVVAVAASGRRLAGALAALTAAVAFDVLLTVPYGSFTISSGADLETFVLLAVTGLIVGQLGAWARNQRSDAEQADDDLGLLYYAAELVAAGEPRDQVVITVALELVELLDLRDCRYQPGPARPDLPIVGRDGRVHDGALVWDVATAGIPAVGAQLPVQRDGRTLGHLVAVPHPGRPLGARRVLVALALADLVGAAAERSGPGPDDDAPPTAARG